MVAAGGPVRVLGTGHSFNRIADTGGTMIGLDLLDEPVVVDRERRTVSVPGGWTFGRLSTVLDEHGLALRNLGSLPHISIAGACATGTHGSGDRNGTIAGSVAALELVDGTGTVRNIDRTDPDFPGTVIALGALGVVTRVTLDLVPAYEIRQRVYADLPLDDLGAHLDEIFSPFYSASVFTDWHRPHAHAWIKARPDQPLPEDGWLGTRRLTAPWHPIDGAAPDACTPNLGEPGPWYARLPHFRLDFTPSSGDELQSEYYVPRDAAPDAFAALRRLGPRIAPLALACEVRTLAAEDLWLSPAHDRPTVALHFTWKPDPDAVTALLPDVERALAPYGPRTHWGKLATMPPDAIAAQYPYWSAFARLLPRYDPGGTFRNPYVNRLFPPG